jgi:hypothetical protein
MPSPRLVLSDAIAFTDWCAFSPFEPCPLPCRHGAPLCSSTSRLCSTEESVALRATLPLRARSMLPWALDRTRSDAAARFAPPSFAGRFAWRSEPLRRPSTRTSREGRVFRPCLAPGDALRCDPRRDGRV